MRYGNIPLIRVRTSQCSNLKYLALAAEVGLQLVTSAIRIPRVQRQSASRSGLLLIVMFPVELYIDTSEATFSLALSSLTKL